MLNLVTGVSGQDGSYLAEQLTQAGQRVVGVIPPGQALPPYLATLQHTSPVQLATCDLADPHAFRLLLRQLKPERVFHLAAISSPRQVQRDPAVSRAVNVTSLEVLLEYIRREQPEGRILAVSSAWIFGESQGTPWDETAAPQPTTEYARQKQQVRELAAQARTDGYFAACAIPFSHESPRRTEEFVFAKICYSAARIKLGLQQRLALGDLRSQRDWGYAPEYTTAMAWMLDIERPAELILATGETHSVREVLDLAFLRVGLDPEAALQTDPGLVAEQPVSRQAGLATRAWEELGWEARTKFKELVGLLVDAALADPPPPPGKL